MAARKDFGSDLADTMLTAFKQHLLFLQEAGGYFTDPSLYYSIKTAL